MIYVVPFEEWHFNFLELYGPEKKVVDAFGNDLNDILRAFRYRGITFSWVQKTDVLGVCGVMPQWKGVGEAYMFLSPLFKKNKIRCIKDIRHYLNLIAKQLQLHRVHCQVIKEFDDAVKLAKFLGFKQESIMEKFGPNKEDYISFVKYYELG